MEPGVFREITVCHVLMSPVHVTMSWLWFELFGQSCSNRGTFEQDICAPLAPEKPLEGDRWFSPAQVGEWCRSGGGCSDWLGGGGSSSDWLGGGSSSDWLAWSCRPFRTAPGCSEPRELGYIMPWYLGMIRFLLVHTHCHVWKGSILLKRIPNSSLISLVG
jgi:hypothetical protein